MLPFFCSLIGDKSSLSFALNVLLCNNCKYDLQRFLDDLGGNDDTYKGNTAVMTVESQE